jgi:hypothetical protein
MKTETVTVAFVNPPKTPKGPGNIKLSDGRYVKVWPDDLGHFDKGGSYEIKIEEEQYQGKTYYNFKGFANGAVERNSRVSQFGDDRSKRIERQHSQHMALIAFELIGKTSTDGLREMIDWFQRDIGHSCEKQEQEVEEEKEW